MGGQLMKTNRISAEKYCKIKADLIAVISEYPKVKSYFPRVLGSKLDFGDVDVLLYCPNESFRINPKADKILRAIETVVHSKKMESFVYDSTQIDFIWFYDLKDFEMAKAWYDFGDLSMLVGIIWKRLGCKFTDSGLILRAPHLILSNDPKKIYEFLGLDMKKWCSGFDDEQDVASWIASSRFFHQSFYEEILAEGNAAERRRSAKRSMQIKVMGLLEKMDSVLRDDEIALKCQLEKDVLPKLLHYFDKTEEFNLLIAQEEKRAKFKECFNGKYVSELTGLVNIQLGVFMSYLRSEFADIDKMQNSILNMHEKMQLGQFIEDKFIEWKLKETALSSP